MEVKALDEEYQARMLAFEVDCNDGKGDGYGCHCAGEFFAVVKDDHARAAKVFERNCKDNKYGASCFSLARFFMTGKGVSQDDGRAFQLFEEACSRGNAPGCYHAGLLGRGGLGTKRDPVTAMDRFDRACQEPGNIPEACYEMATLLLKATGAGGSGRGWLGFGRKKGIERDPVRAEALLERACTRGHGPSCFNLAVMYKNGEPGTDGAPGVPADPEKFKAYAAETKRLVKLHGSVAGGVRGT